MQPLLQTVDGGVALRGDGPGGGLGGGGRPGEGVEERRQGLGALQVSQRLDGGGAHRLVLAADGLAQPLDDRGRLGAQLAQDESRCRLQLRRPGAGEHLHDLGLDVRCHDVPPKGARESTKAAPRQPLIGLVGE